MLSISFMSLINFLQMLSYLLLLKIMNFISYFFFSQLLQIFKCSWRLYHLVVFLYKHLLYADFVRFNRESWSCYLKDTANFFKNRAGLVANLFNVCIHYVNIITRNINPQKSSNLQIAIRFSFSLTTLHGDVSV